MTSGPRDVWIFGYGSLVWRPAFDHQESRPAYVRGWERRFWQASVDHRGVPGAPGRVVTLIPSPGAVCWGRAYRVAAHQRDEVVAQLDHRERGGYDRHRLTLHLGPDQIPGALTYVATTANPNYVGAEPLDAIAAIVRSAHGPSGSNREYVLELAEALVAMGATDEHVFALAEAVRTARSPAP